MGKYGEIRDDYYDRKKKCWCIDAWLTEKICEKGMIIAEISEETGEVTYYDDDARYGEEAQSVIKSTCYLIWREKMYRKNAQKNI